MRKHALFRACFFNEIYGTQYGSLTPFWLWTILWMIAGGHVLKTCPQMILSERLHSVSKG